MKQINLKVYKLCILSVACLLQEAAVIWNQLLTTKGTVALWQYSWPECILDEIDKLNRNKKIKANWYHSLKHKKNERICFLILKG